MRVTKYVNPDVYNYSNKIKNLKPACKQMQVEENEYMNLPLSVTQEELLDILLNIAPVRPVFIWGAPGIGKSALVEEFAETVGLPCVSLLGSQLAPEDIIGIPQIKGETSEFLPPKMIARKEPYVLFLDELNACSLEVQKTS